MRASEGFESFELVGSSSFPASQLLRLSRLGVVRGIEK